MCPGVSLAISKLAVWSWFQSPVEEGGGRPVSSHHVAICHQPCRSMSSPALEAHRQDGSFLVTRRWARPGVRRESSQWMNTKEGDVNVRHRAWPSKSFLLTGCSSRFIDFVLGGLLPLFCSRCFSAEQAFVVRSDGHVENVAHHDSCGWWLPRREGQVAMFLVGEAHTFISQETPLPALAALVCSCLLSGWNPGGLPGRHSGNVWLQAAHSLLEDGWGWTGGKGQAGNQQPTQVSACAGRGGQKLLPLLPGIGEKGTQLSS